jgi:hypothetical protein
MELFKSVQNKGRNGTAMLNSMKGVISQLEIVKEKLRMELSGDSLQA